MSYFGRTAFAAAAVVGSIFAVAPAQAVTVTIQSIGAGSFNYGSSTGGFLGSSAAPMITYDVDGTEYSAQLSITLQYGAISSPGVMSFQLGSVMLVGENTSYYLFMGAPSAVWTGLGLGSAQQTLQLGPVSINPPASTLDPAVAAGLADALSRLTITTHADTSTLTSGKPTSGTFAIEAASFVAPAVPEPASWALMIVGFGVVGAAMRMRSRQAAFAA